MAVVFVYGTLTNLDRVSSVLNRYTLGPDAVCQGLQRVDGTYPTLAPGGRTTGRLLATPEIGQLDQYEGVDRGLYCRVSVPLSSTAGGVAVDSPFAAETVETAEVYIGNPSLLECSDAVKWSGSGLFAQRVRSFISSNSVRIHTSC